MRSLRLISCGLAPAMLTAAPTVAQSPSAPAAAESADRFTNRDLMAQPERERRVWLEGLIVGVVYGIGLLDNDAGECMASWYSNDADQIYANIIASMEHYPDHQPSIIVLALARRACPNIIGQS